MNRVFLSGVIKSVDLKKYTKKHFMSFNLETSDKTGIRENHKIHLDAYSSELFSHLVFVGSDISVVGSLKSRSFKMLPYEELVSSYVEARAISRNVEGSISTGRS